METHAARDEAQLPRTATVRKHGIWRHGFRDDAAFGFPHELKVGVTPVSPGVPGADDFIFAGDSDADLDEIEEFLTGARQSHPTDRVLATVMFTDIVAST
jgi:hypothetical protein